MQNILPIKIKNNEVTNMPEEKTSTGKMITYFILSAVGIVVLVAVTIKTPGKIDDLGNVGFIFWSAIGMTRNFFVAPPGSDKYKFGKWYSVDSGKYLTLRK